ncbi:MAG TPA: hypothetical protein DGD08_10915 [Gemmatimonas aurantiaca]|nr:carboxypeptidase-like regulatory domain-containing protein [Gemmatimonas aurantiaca]HCT57700.1 hypothetical protein [Gemmatimonas aurantiaca]
MTTPLSNRLRRLVWWTGALAIPSITNAQPAVAQPTGARVAAVRGVVFDSLAGVPLGDATVQLVSADGSGAFGKTVSADRTGQFYIDSVPDGRYALGFFHPKLDSLGMEAPLRMVQVSNQQNAVVGTGIPAPKAYRAMVCGSAANPLGNAALVGFVRDATTHAPVPGATVLVSWLEMSLGGAGGTQIRTVRRTAKTSDNGWYSVCQVPSPGSIQVSARSDAGGTDTLQLEVPSSGLLRRELAVGAAHVTVVQDGASKADTSGLPPRVMQTGDGTLRGTVVGAAIGASAGRPLVGATVGMANGPQTRTDAKGEWTLSSLPRGTRALEVRAVGYYPERLAVDVVEDAPPQHVSLVTFKSVLDTMKVIASPAPLVAGGFLERRRSGLGTYITANDIAVKTAMMTSEIFRNIPGIYLEYPQSADIDGERPASSMNSPEPVVLMRSNAGTRCFPTIVYNGTLMQHLSTPDLNSFLNPKNILAIEVYRPGQAPPNFQIGLSGCGSIVLWTR